MSMTDLINIDELRGKQQQVWSSGDYNKIAALTVPVNETVVAAAAVAPGDLVLDVATGTGHSAIAAARQGARATGIDYVPALLDIARARAEAEQIAVDFVESPAESLPFADGCFDAVVSSIGVMFAADHQAAANEIARVTRSGGRIALGSWTAEGFIGGMLRIVGAHVTPPAGAQSPVRWGDVDVVTGLFGEAVTNLTSTVHTLPVRFADAAAFADHFLAFYGPTHSASRRLDVEGKASLRAALIEHAEASGRVTHSGALHLDWEYRVVTATRA